ncbi:hypothetical protein [Acidithiobacillus sp. IBUN Pt1247-S3]|uniref:hypothetical protein n=1 Tax=Acidithiobacillus sp. IBUN Pt1247-S3 TaxID=3166642 RepID=UPI0034E4E81F
MHLVDRLSTAGFDGLSLALDWKTKSAEGKEPDEVALIEHALAAASGRAYAAHGPDKLDWIGQFVASFNGLLWEDFAAAAATVFRENSDLLERFVGFLDGIIERANDAPDTLTEILPQYVSMASIVEEFAQTGRSFQDVWEADLRPVLFRSSGAFEILRRADAGRFVTMIDQLPHPALVKQCLSSKALQESPQDVLVLLPLANSTIDIEGRWNHCGMAAILLLKLASEQLLSLCTGEDDAGDLNKDIAHFSDAVGEVLDVLFARPDGVELAWCWLENLLRQIPRVPHMDRNNPREMIVDRIGILVHALGNRLNPRRAQDTWIMEAAPAMRQYRVVSALSVAAFTSMASNLDLGAVAKDLLMNTDFELTRANEFIHLPGAPLRMIPGYALARIPDTASWFTSTWSALRFRRERAWRAGRNARGNPAEIMGLWGLGAIEVLTSTPERHDDASRMWHALDLAFREARLVEPKHPHDFWIQVVARIFRWWPQIFTTDLLPAGGSVEAASFDPTVLGRVLIPYVEISGDFMAVIVSLRQAGLTASILDDAIRSMGQDLLNMIHRFMEVTHRLSDRRVWNPVWVEALRRVEAELTGRRKYGTS